MRIKTAEYMQALCEYKNINFNGKIEWATKKRYSDFKRHWMTSKGFINKIIA